MIHWWYSLSALRLVGTKLIGRRLRLFITLILIACGLFLCHAWWTQPRVWHTSEVPVAFWTWRSDSPSQASVQRALDLTGARALFIRAGQIDIERSTVRRIRALTGDLPRGIEVHLVYNATGDLLAGFEAVDEHMLASTICETYLEDVSDARDQGVQVAGLQLDIDVPTRLLPRYELLLRVLRERLPHGTILSITGLPTWMNSPSLSAALDAVNFWVPQFYGASTPVRLDRATPISSPEEVAGAIDLARKLKRPFYAGLAAYGYAINFGRDGKRVQVSGSLDLQMVAGNDNLELVENRLFSSLVSTQGQTQTPSNGRYLYRARKSCTVGGLLVREGEWLMLDLPSAAVLRACARVVRERAGDRLLGICVFRLPESNEPTSLTIQEIAAALSDTDPSASTELQARELPSPRAEGSRIALTCSNAGTTRGLLGEEGLCLYVTITGVRMVYPNGFDSSDLFFSPSGEISDHQSKTWTRCSVSRANVVRLAKRTWNPGTSATAIFDITGPPPDALSVQVRVQAQDGVTRSESQIVKLERMVLVDQTKVHKPKH